MDSDSYPELPYREPCPECGTPLDGFGECMLCIEDEYYRELSAEEAA